MKPELAAAIRKRCRERGIITVNTPPRREMRMQAMDEMTKAMLESNESLDRSKAMREKPPKVKMISDTDTDKDKCKEKRRMKKASRRANR